METTPNPLDIENTSPINSPNTNENAISTTNNMDFVQNQIQIETPPLTPRSYHQINPYPTTFVQANTSTFKQVVQMLTGSSSSQSKQNPDSNFNSNKNPIPLIKTSHKKQQQQQGTFKLYERRNQLRNQINIINLLINNNNNNDTTGIGNLSPRKQEMILSPSLLDFPNKLVLSPVTPLNEDLFNNKHNSSSNSSCNSSSSKSSLSEEDKAIAEKGFYLHQSPVNTPRECQPELLLLFPVTSPRVSGSSS